MKQAENSEAVKTIIENLEANTMGAITTQNRRYVSAKTLAGILGVTPWTIRQWVIRGKIPAIKINARVLRFDLQRVGRALGMDLTGEIRAVAEQNGVTETDSK